MTPRRSIRRKITGRRLQAALVLMLLAIAPIAGWGLGNGQGAFQESESDRQQRLAKDRWQGIANDATARVEKAHKLWAEGHRTEAITVMLLAHRDLNTLGGPPEDDPFDPGSGYQLAQMYQETGDLNEAYLLYRRVVAPLHGKPSGILRQRPDIQLAYFEVCKALKKDAEAKQVFGGILKGDPLKVYKMSAYYGFHAGRVDDAERWYREALRIAPGDPFAEHNLQLLLDAKARGLKSTIG